MERYTERISEEIFDLLVVGGGITGAAIAYEAASRGLSVVLFEKGDFSEATSAASSKMIHGGLRYLNNMEFSLVRESLRERRILSNIAPNFVYPIPMIFPHYRGSLKTNKWMIKTGLMLYDLLGFGKSNTWDKSKRIPSHKTVSPETALSRYPVIPKNGLTGASIFYDCINLCPERLTLAFIKSALSHGARAANYARVTGFLLDQKRDAVCGVTVRDLLTQKTHSVKARVTLNCAGPWADKVLGLLKDENPVSMKRSEGIHVITRKLFHEDGAVGVITPRRRHCFLLSWRDHTLVGTTDSLYEGDPDDYRVTFKGIEDLLQEVNNAFAGLTLTVQDVLHAYGGLRPLVGSRQTETYRATRRYEIHESRLDAKGGLLTVEGGKWTTSRGLAQKVLDHLRKKTELPIGPSVSQKRYLKGSEIRDINRFLFRIKEENRDYDPKALDYVGRLYGTEYQNVLALCKDEPLLRQTLNTAGDILAQVVYGVRHEMARTLQDVLLRRTGIATLGNPGEAILLRAARIMGDELGWNEEKILAEIHETMDFLKIPSQ
jgi:glycerol-3-phosphate dehydrogenase